MRPDDQVPLVGDYGKTDYQVWLETSSEACGYCLRNGSDGYSISGRCAVKVLFTSPIIEHPPAGGPQLRIHNSIKALARVCDLRIVARTSRDLVDFSKGLPF